MKVRESGAQSVLSYPTEGAFSGVTNSGRVWIKVPESDARFSGLINFGRIWGKVPESDARSMGQPIGGR